MHKKTKMTSDMVTHLINDKPAFRNHNQILILKQKAGCGDHKEFEFLFKRR